MLVFVTLLALFIINWLGSQLLANGPIVLLRALGTGGWLLLGLVLLGFVAWCLGGGDDAEREL
ncbi:MAG: hypothetical protein AAGG51_06300 [Cyanobacteria bacterium P01_G01_bin.54]